MMHPIVSMSATLSCPADRTRKIRGHMEHGTLIGMHDPARLLAAYDEPLLMACLSVRRNAVGGRGEAELSATSKRTSAKNLQCLPAARDEAASGSLRERDRIGGSV